MALRAVGYLRVSSAGQRDRHTIDAQRVAISSWITSQGWKLARPISTYVDDGRSARAGKLEKRDGLNRLLADVGAGVFDLVVVVDIDRLTRSEDLTERGAVLGAFQRAGVKIAIVGGQVLDLSSAMGDLYSGLQSFFAADWARKHVERIKRGKDLAIAKGKKPAGPTPYGFRYDRWTGVWSHDEHEASIIRECFRRVAAGEPCFGIGLDFVRRGVPSPQGGLFKPDRVWAIVRNTVYKGQWFADKAKGISISVPPIVSEAEWDAAQDALKRHHKRGLRKTKHTYLLEGLARCALCGGRINIASGTKPKRGRTYQSPPRYVCTHRINMHRKGVAKCFLPYRPIPEVDDRLWAALVRELTRADLLALAAAKDQEANKDRAAWLADVKEGTRRIARLEETESAHLERHRAGKLSAAALDRELDAIARERRQHERQVETARRGLRAADQKQARAESLQELVKAARGKLEAATPETRQAFVRAVVEQGSVVLHADEIEATLVLRASLVESGQLVDEAGTERVLRIRMVA